MAKRKTATNAGKPYQVFLSHATADKWLATTLCEKIEQTGAVTFRDDRDIDGGEDIPEAIRKQIKQSQEIVVLMTPDSINRTWVTLEIGAAWGWSRKMRIVLVLCHVPVDPIPDIIKGKKAIHINEFNSYLEELKLRVQ